MEKQPPSGIMSRIFMGLAEWADLKTQEKVRDAEKLKDNAAKRRRNENPQQPSVQKMFQKFTLVDPHVLFRKGMTILCCSCLVVTFIPSVLQTVQNFTVL